MPVTHGVTGSSPVHTATKKRNSVEFLFFVLYIRSMDGDESGAGDFSGQQTLDSAEIHSHLHT